MTELPEDVSLEVMRGLGRYIDQAPTSELPASVRRFKGFRAKALAKHRATVLAMLDIDATRSLIVQWLSEDKPSLPDEVEAALRLVTERPEGWEKAIAERSRDASSGREEEGATDSHAKSLAREKEKAARARSELKQLREEGQRAVAEERAARAKLEQTVAALEKELSEAVARAEKAEEALVRERQHADRELRRARRDSERARQNAAELDSRLKELEARSPAPESEKAPPKKRPPRKTPTTRARTGPRSALKIPKGFLGDDPEVLRSWLERDDVHLLVDGYNVTKAPSGFGDLSLETQRDRLLTSLNTLAARTKTEVTVVFDGTSVIRPKGKRKAVRAIFTTEGEIADDRIVELLDDLPPVPVVVATNDRELQERVSARGATVASSDQLLALLH